MHFLLNMNSLKIMEMIEELKSAIESGRMSTNLGELKNYLIEIDEGIFGFVPDPEKL